MAEIMILVLFALLLIWMTGLRDRDRQLQRADVATRQANEATRQANEATARINELKEEIQRLLGSPDRANAFDDQFRELVIARTKIAELESELAKLQEASQILNDIAEKTGPHDRKNTAAAIEERLQISDRLIRNMRRQGSVKSSSVSDDELAKETASLMVLRDQLQKNGQNATQVLQIIEESRSKAEDAEAQTKTLQGRLQNFQQRIAALGKGTEKPACWADPITGKPEYIFDIALQSAAIRVHDNALPQRVRDQAKLPLSDLQFDKPLGFGEFRVVTDPLFQWSEKEGCRFFVRVLDETAAHEKAKYKLVLRTVQEHFYTFENAVVVQ